MKNPGLAIRTSSPGCRTARNTRSSACMAPLVTSTRPALTLGPRAWSDAAIACRSPGSPSDGVYPLADTDAAIASTTCDGRSTYGEPASRSLRPGWCCCSRASTWRVTGSSTSAGSQGPDVTYWPVRSALCVRRLLLTSLSALLEGCPADDRLCPGKPLPQDKCEHDPGHQVPEHDQRQVVIRRRLRPAERAQRPQRVNDHYGPDHG